MLCRSKASAPLQRTSATLKLVSCAFSGIRLHLLFTCIGLMLTCTVLIATNHLLARLSLSNTAKLSSPIFLPRTVSYDAGIRQPCRGSNQATRSAAMPDSKTNRRRRSSSILQVYHEPLEPIEQLSDQSALPNGNANWVNAKGAIACPVKCAPRFHRVVC